MVSWTDTYSLIAELAIAITGFAAIIGVFANIGDLQKRSEEYFRLQWLLTYSVFAVFGSLLPFFVFDWVDDVSTGWQLSSGIWVAGFVVANVLMRKDIRRWIGTRSIFVNIFGLGDTLVLIGLIANAASLWVEPSARLYSLALYWNIIGAIAGFLFFLALIWSDPSEHE